MLITDGKQTGNADLSAASSGLKNKGVTVYAIGVGNNVDVLELRKIASSQKHVLNSPSFQELHNLNSVLLNMCKGESCD